MSPLHCLTSTIRSAAIIAIVYSCALASAAERNTGPWDMKKYDQPPAATFGEREGLVQPVYYEGEPYQGKPTRVFAYYARPATGSGPWPAMVLVHGGGGKAFAEWATLWAQRGFVALAMDTAGHGPDGKRLADGGPDQDDNTKFRDFAAAEADQMWTYHAVAAALRGYSLLADQKEVDATRIGVTGISWGGYLTSIIAGIDSRLKVAVPVYGCGFLQEDSCWIPGYFSKMTDERRDRWVKFFDPSQYLAGVSCPILFVNGTNDFAYPLDSYQKSYRLVPDAEELLTLCIKVNMPHGHPQGWSPPEIGLFVDSVLKRGEPLPHAIVTTADESQVKVNVATKLTPLKAQLNYTHDTGPWQKRAWQTSDAVVDGIDITAKLPAERPLVYFVTISDSRGAVVSTQHVTLPAK